MLLNTGLRAPTMVLSSTGEPFASEMDPQIKDIKQVQPSFTSSVDHHIKRINLPNS
jgi:hypothetical protein